MDKHLVFEDFADKLEHTFVVSDQNVPAIPMALAEAQRLPARGLPPGTRPPFALVFLAKDPRVLPQRLYKLEHDEMGALQLFLVPIGKDAHGVSYQATFA